MPPGNNVDSHYELRVEGGHYAGHGQGAIIFENETKLEFSRQFLSVSIRYSTYNSIATATSFVYLCNKTVVYQQT